MENENIAISKFSDKLVCIDTIADGNCLIHAILKASNEDYQNTSSVFYRKNMAIHYRKLLSEAILKPDNNYSTIEDMANLVRYEYKTEQPRNFMEFLRTMYNYTTSYISYPNPIMPTEKLKLFNIQSVKKYIVEYKEYLINFNEKIESKLTTDVRCPNINHNIDDIPDEISDTDLKNIEILNLVYKDLEDVIDSHIKNLKHILEKTLSYYLYIPTFFNKEVIEKALTYEEKDGEIIPVSLDKLPKGIYSEFPFNCFLFSASGAVPLFKFEFEYNKLPGIVKLGDIPRHLDSRRFIGDGDAMLYVPYLLCVNLIVMDFETNSVLAIYENEHSDKYVIINNDNNVHFETIGVITKLDNSVFLSSKDNLEFQMVEQHTSQSEENISEFKISTIFEKNHPLVLECLKRPKVLDLSFL
jgi:hypothetical protein